MKQLNLFGDSTEEHKPQVYLSEIRSPDKQKDDLFALFSKNYVQSVEFYSERYFQDCVTVNQCCELLFNAKLLKVYDVELHKKLCKVILSSFNSSYNLIYYYANIQKELINFLWEYYDYEVTIRKIYEIIDKAYSDVFFELAGNEGYICKEVK